MKNRMCYVPVNMKKEHIKTKGSSFIEIYFLGSTENENKTI